MSNTVEHAYTGQTGTIEIAARVTPEPRGYQRVVIHVMDYGQWRARGGQSGNRGHGLAVMSGAMAQVDVQSNHRGTTVTLTSSPVDRCAPD